MEETKTKLSSIYNDNKSFKSILSGLMPGRTYYIQAYAHDGNIEVYGDKEVFTTLTELPGITTAPVSSITNVSAVSGGEIYSDGGIPVLARGVCWSIHENPTLADNKTNDGNGNGYFTS